MKLTALILAATFVGLTLFACGVPYSLTGVSPPATATTHACNDAGTALNAVPYVVAGFSPASNKTPTPDSVAIQQDIQTDLNNAFAAASTSFRAQLCKLNGIFIDPTGCTRPNSNSPYTPTTCQSSAVAIADNSWGMRQYSVTNGTGKTIGEYVGLSLGLWNNTSNWSCPGTQTLCALPFQTYQTAVLQAEVQALSPTQISTGNLPYVSAVSFNSQSYNPSAMSVLATLAHEYGHVLWYDTFVTNPGGSAANASCPAGIAGQFYPQPSAGLTWQYPVDVPPGRYLAFGQIRSQSISTSAILQIPGLYTNPTPSNLKSAAGSLYHLYGSAYWASPLAAFSPDEDFVETFALTVLASANPPLTSMQIAVPGFPHYDVFSNLIGNTELARKYQCIAGALPPAAQLRR
jgi:hypothetical protein